MEKPFTELLHQQTLYKCQKRKYWYAITLNPKGKQVSREELLRRFTLLSDTSVLYCLTIIETKPKNHMHGIILSEYPLITMKTKKLHIVIPGLTIHLKFIKSIYDWEIYCMKHKPDMLYEYNVPYDLSHKFKVYQRKKIGNYKFQSFENITQNTIDKFILLGLQM